MTEPITLSDYDRTIWFDDDEWKPKGARIKWKKCVDGYRETHCGKWQIETIDWDCGEPNSYKVCSHDFEWKSTADTLKEAKRMCEEQLRIQLCDGDKDKAHNLMVADGYEPTDPDWVVALKANKEGAA